MSARLSPGGDISCELTALMIASVPWAAWSGQRRYDRTLYTVSCSRACLTTFTPKSSSGLTSLTGA
jgi:hypothetical protein